MDNPQEKYRILREKYKDYITEKYSDYLGKNYVHFDVSRAELEKGGMVIRNKTDRVIVDLKKYQQVREDIADWRMLQGRVEFAEKKKLEQFNGYLN